MEFFKKYFVVIFTAGILAAGTCPVFALDLDRLSDADIAQVQKILEELEPLIREREAQETLATLTFDELYSPLGPEDREFLKQFESLDAAELGVMIPYQGIATGEEELTVIRGQEIMMNGERKTIPAQYLPPKTYEAYLAMMDAMEKDLGKRLYIESGYRSSAYQMYLFVFYLKNHEYSIRETVRWVALPGYSEHGAPQYQAIDFINQDGISGEEHPEDFENLEEYQWLVKNAGRFNFLLSYPKGFAGITFEPWHWHYRRL